MYRFWKFEREDAREKWDKRRAREIQRRKEKRQEVFQDDSAVWLAAVAALLYHLGLLPEGEKK